MKENGPDRSTIRSGPDYLAPLRRVDLSTTFRSRTHERAERASRKSLSGLAEVVVVLVYVAVPLLRYIVLGENGNDRTNRLRDKLYARIVNGLGQDRCRLNGHPENRLPNTLNISISDIIGEELLQHIPEIAASTGAACHAGSTEPSAVLLEMGLSRELALGALRLTLGRWTTEQEIAAAGDLIVERASQLATPV